ncbi:EAL domain-containing protein [Wenzhouxiangella sp. AB-CW3]|uniref:EAL domain-containing protein n=1 Tax=Wenzhouxiangella sp. AB-CW3 TaxID=2771012 RepID=UPI00168B6D64|nr:EAL domain-containing protein [Wenzhouxiangella sp. AB-CW3]QOC21133.1 EAL domain-containing protein [Wenzhouxiangella sp. AB-CW3]
MARQAADIRILTVTDDPSAPRELEQMLGSDSGARILFADTTNAVARTFEEGAVDMIVIHVDSADIGLLDATVRLARDQKHFVPILAVVDGEDARAVQAVATLGVEGFVSAINMRQFKRLARSQLESLQARLDARQALRSLEDIEARYTLLLDSSSEAIAYLHEGLHIYANPAYLELFGFAEFEELEGLSMLDLFSASRDGQDLKKVLKALSRDDIPQDAMLLKAQRQDGSTFKASVAFSPARYGGEYCAQMLVHEELEQADPKLQAELQKLKTQDMLTGMLNSASFQDRLKAQVAERNDPSGLSVLLFSLDKFDELAEKVGVGASDNLISEQAKLFQSIVGKDQVVARLRDHTFGLLADCKSREEAEKLATRIVEDCNGKLLEVRDTSLTVSGSVGLAVAGSEVPEPVTLIDQAEMALAEALRSGGNSFARYRPKVSGEGDEDDAIWAERLRHAIDHDEFGLVSSAITCMEDDNFLINDIETRLRAEDSDEVIMPGTYMPAASRVGMAARLDLDMLERFRQLLTDRKPDDSARWLIPLSLDTITDSDALARVETLLEELPVDANRIIWGLREQEIRDKLRQAQAFIELFRGRGCRSALCDVEAGVSVDPILQHLEVDFLRLAPSVVHDLGNNEKLREQLSILAKQAQDRNVRVIAPRIDHTGDLATLWQFGITLVQGDFVREAATT